MAVSAVGVTGQPTSTSKPGLVPESSDVKFILTDVAVDGIHSFKFIPLGRDAPECPSLYDFQNDFSRISLITQRLPRTHEFSVTEVDCEKIVSLFSVIFGDHDFWMLSICTCEVFLHIHIVIIRLQSAKGTDFYSSWKAPTRSLTNLIGCSSAQQHNQSE